MHIKGLNTVQARTKWTNTSPTHQARCVHASELMSICVFSEMCQCTLTLLVCMSYFFVNRGVMRAVIKKPTRLILTDQHKLNFSFNKPHKRTVKLWFGVETLLWSILTKYTQKCKNLIHINFDYRGDKLSQWITKEKGIPSWRIWADADARQRWRFPCLSWRIHCKFWPFTVLVPQQWFKKNKRTSVKSCVYIVGGLFWICSE